MTNILYIFHISEIGGGSFCLLNIIKSLDRKKFNPIVLLSNPGPLSFELNKISVKVFFDKDVRAMPYNQSFFKLGSVSQLFSILRFQFKIGYWLRKSKADIVHLL